jgi:type IV pilus assembly protein PilY1
METPKTSRAHLFRSLAIGGLLLLMFEGHNAAQANAACCLEGTSRATTRLNPPVGEDNRFFTAEGSAKPTLELVFMNHRRMLELPYTLTEIRTAGAVNSNNNGLPIYLPALDPLSALFADLAPTGCQNTILNALSYFHPEPRNGDEVLTPSLAGPYDNAKTYSAPEDAYFPTLAQPNSGPDTLFQSGKYYAFLDWGHDCSNSDRRCVPKATAAEACTRAGAGLALSPANLACQTCLNTRGYWLNPATSPAVSDNTAGAFKGNWLNFFPPKHVMMRLALKTVLKEAGEDGTRIGVFSSDVGSGANVEADIKTTCGSGTPVKSGVGNMVTGLKYRDDEKNPIAEVLTNLGQYLSKNGRWETIFRGPKKTTSGIDYKHDADANATHCTACTRHFILLFSDGRGDEGNPRCVANAAGNPVPPCTRVNQCNVEGLGIEDDGNEWIRDLAGYGQATTTGSAIRKTPPDTCDRDYADDIARFLYETDMYENNTGMFGGIVDNARQFAYTYTVGVGSNFNGRQRILAEIAKAGGGKYMNATSYQTMLEVLRTVLAEVNRQATSFSSTAVAQLQTSSGTAAFVPRFKPDRDRLWNGFLYRWGVFNEFVEDRDLNTDGDKEDVFLVQKTLNPNGAQRSDIVGEDEQGNFILPNNANLPAVPWWEANQRLTNLAASRGLNARRIYTVLDDADPRGRIDSRDTLIEFNESNVDRLLPYLGLQGTTTCSRLSEAMIDPTIATDLRQCALLLIRYTRGHDVLDADGNGNRNETREHLLGDVFHSPPTLLDVPSDRFLCDLGLSPQCARTIYDTVSSSGAATPLERYTVAGGEIDAYTKFREQYKQRDRLLLAGSNDGMLHAFHAGAAIVPAPVPSATNILPDSHDKGTGDEVWAFVPPDLLSKLQLRLVENAHNYYVDGDVLVRDIWSDKASGNVGRKDWDEFRTMVVISERRGGNHYLALDVTAPDSTDTWYPNAPKPSFRWMFPQPCSDEAYEVGETFMSVAPKPPPIGPVLLKSTNAAFPVRYGMNTEERWVVFLSGGYDTNYSRGQGLYVLDIASGNMVWKANFDRAHARHKYLRYPIAAPVAAVDFGSGGGNLDQDGFFDTAIVGDMGGQLWTLRMFAPGDMTLPPAASSSNESSARLVSNWYLSRAFQQEASEGIDGAESGIVSSQSTTNLAKINPIFTIAATAYQSDTGALRALFGTGDRYNLRDGRGGTCRVDNPMACAKYGCEWKSDLTLDYGGKKVQAHTHFAGGLFRHLTRTVTANAAQTNACEYMSAHQVDTVNNCPGNVNLGTIKDIERLCSGNPRACSHPFNTYPPAPPASYEAPSSSDSLLAMNRFYGLWAYGGKASRSFDSEAAATAYDDARLRDLGTTNLNLTNVTAATASTGGALESGNGWYMEMARLPERTASSAAIVASCALWNSIDASTGSTSGCSTGQTYASKLYQANVFTGKPNCAASMNGARSISRQLRATPPEPALAIAISKTGQIKYQLQSFEPGGAQAMKTDVDSNTDILQLVYSVELTGAMHSCRHVADAGTCL